jgi:hypothetical protein
MDKSNGSRHIFRVIQGTSKETIQRSGAAIKEHLVAYTGKTPLRGQNGEAEMKKSLRKIGQYKVSREYRYQNQKQQAGFVFEILTVEKGNTQGSHHGKAIRTDDMQKQVAADGHEFGKVNDQLYDVARVDTHGKYIEGSAAQLKFYGESGTDCAKSLLETKFDKYRAHDVRIEVPSDQYDEARAYLKSEIDLLEKDARELERKGKTEAAAKKRAKKKKAQQTKRLLKKGKVSSKEIMFATKHPGLHTAVEIGKTAHKAGVEQAKTGMIIAGASSIVRHLVACLKEEITPQDAAIGVLKDTGVGATVSYATAFTSAIATGIMKKSGSEYVRGLSGTGFVSGMVSSTLDISKVMIRYIRGDITGAQCIEQLGENGFGQLGSAMYSTLAVAAVKGTGSFAVKAVAGLVGSTVGYAAAVAVYQELATSLKEYELAVENRKRIEAECEEAVKMICEYRLEMERMAETYLSEHLQTFSEGFDAIDKAIMENDIHGFLKGNAMIQAKLGHVIQFTNQKEFDELMLSDEDFIL